MVARAWEWLRRKKPLVDAFFALPVVAFTLPSLLGGTSGLGPVRYLLLSAGLIAPLVLRRTFPRAVFVAVVLVSGVQCLLGVIPVPANLAVLMVLYTITANYTFRWGSPRCWSSRRARSWPPSGIRVAPRTAGSRSSC